MENVVAAVVAANTQTHKVSHVTKTQLKTLEKAQWPSMAAALIAERRLIELRAS